MTEKQYTEEIQLFFRRWEQGTLVARTLTILLFQEVKIGNESLKGDLENSIKYPFGTYLLYRDGDRRLKISIKAICTDRPRQARLKRSLVHEPNNKDKAYYIKAKGSPSGTSLAEMIKMSREMFELKENMMTLIAEVSSFLSLF